MWTNSSKIFKTSFDLLDKINAWRRKGPRGATAGLNWTWDSIKNESVIQCLLDTFKR